MDSDFDPRREAEAVMKLAAAAEGPERQRLLGLAIGWLELAPGRSLPHGIRDGSEFGSLVIGDFELCGGLQWLPAIAG